MAGLSQNAIMEYVMKQPGSRPLSRQTGSVGYDLAACNALKIPGNGFSLVNTGLQLVIPEGHVGQVCSRSGLAANHGITAQAGVIDPNYRGEIKVLLFNHCSTPYEVQAGERIAQIIFTKIATLEVKHVLSLGPQHATERGEQGFGSTGRI